MWRAESTWDSCERGTPEAGIEGEMQNILQTQRVEQQSPHRRLVLGTAGEDDVLHLGLGCNKGE